VTRSPLAVKRLDGNHQGEKQFRAEVSSIGIIQHINLVKLIGFCCEGDKRLLVYEYMPKHSLDVLLFKKASSDTALDWNLRYQIAVGVARGVAHLHTGCRAAIIHDTSYTVTSSQRTYSSTRRSCLRLRILGWQRCWEENLAMR